MSSSRVPLLPKKDSVLNSRTPSPEKSTSNSPSNKINPFVALLVRLPRINVDLTPRKLPSSLDFTIYEDTPEEALRYRSQIPNYAADSADDKENILQPKKMPSKQSTRPSRKPLDNLSAEEYPGYVTGFGGLRKGPVRLREVFHSKTFINESRTVHKYNRLPSYITPPRNLMKKILYSSGTDEDDIERRLAIKLRELARRKRLMSVGFNRGKAHLISKNLFKIST